MAGDHAVHALQARHELGTRKMPLTVRNTSGPLPSS
jgi:hypothetical protein